MIGLCMLGVLGLVIAYVYRAQIRVAYDPETFCPKAGAKSVTVVLIDATDAFDPLQAQALENRVAELQADIERDGVLELYLVAPVAGKPLEPLLRRCNPGRPDDASGWTENPRLVEKAWRLGFQEPLREAVSRAQHTKPASTSPILSSLQSAALTAFGGSEHAGQPRRLLLVSDLLEHTDRFSLYRSPPDAVAFLADPELRRLVPPLQGVEVELRIIERDSQRQTPELGAFWGDLIAAGGGRVVRRGRLLGLPE